jgi:hypothetical protein
MISILWLLVINKLDKVGLDKQQLFDIMSTSPSNSPFMHFCKNYAVEAGLGNGNVPEIFDYFKTLEK